MTKFVAGGAFLVVFLVWANFASAESGLISAYGNESSWKMTHDVGKMVGTDVTDRDGRNIAKVEDFVMSGDGRISFAILAYSGKAGKNERVAVPYSVLFYNEANREFITNITKDHLASAPKIRDTADLAGHEYAEKVYRHFGLQPPWGNEEANAEMGY